MSTNINYVSTNKAPSPAGPYSQAVVTNGFVYVSGQIPLDPETRKIVSEDIREQTIQTLKNLGKVLEAAGCSYQNLIKTTVYIKDMNDFDVMNKAYGEVIGEARPARACVEVARLPLDVKIEVDAIASLNS
ncbi:translation initiation inhibitor [Rhizophagus irregularis]|uniref:Translation initiation inhibitor n=3 Tax=Rhizophagus irregularis TaxID=588596 RepID=U9TC48_RHIID|nr:translation initiation inhibitor [Rhizophagus irregularis DAOM 181602=DAOM 197198]EXX59382.1 Mmf1p [Rhizophagus irregularis DAOM 197198w]PKC13255.1 translation initiation inhibitor [Rhizophagus irregularis]RGB33547.1 translation initiation inhibitor [Rhizophagus diaphanus] [Rhizophagus sp. MUCL 43196]PKC76455.1 translation initiation inhibitor [Rhizophagus irregularis]PKK79603.1 translation initiation inhibitor [Rhizophagus irregularis]|eukprot:XP_025168703.1 translation initiation inhibitor [Rhizophagus irregularis DAOM 181602=DAOM 197198]